MLRGNQTRPIAVQSEGNENRACTSDIPRLDLFGKWWEAIATCRHLNMTINDSAEILRSTATRLQEVSISFQCNPNELAASPHLGLGEQLLQGIFNSAF
jgi:hypothetical protein